MIVKAQVTINAPINTAWAVITNIGNMAEIVSGIQRIEIVERPTYGLIGLKWRESRILFGELATVAKWITEVEENAAYTTRAEDSGFVFLATNRISIGKDGVILTSIHETLPQTFAARLKALPLIFFKSAIKKAILQDLNDIKSVAERS
ncbi:SRPBCC family protein [Leptospira barantonii]|uniref:SRPBCC family protein n=1 Tax=Leptospira barantonii TaxID=2023184 RepID=A0A5F2AZU6_9LEPT|nr:SRPBCC family protein [Leptospira barantonii]TGL97413.1 SRPBCC family protein [Leptospira barantonii]